MREFIPFCPIQEKINLRERKQISERKPKPVFQVGSQHQMWQNLDRSGSVQNDILPVLLWQTRLGAHLQHKGSHQSQVLHCKCLNTAMLLKGKESINVLRVCYAYEHKLQW